MHWHQSKWLGLVLGMLLAGCSARVDLGQVQGTVRAGGQPLSNVLVTFIPEGKSPTGVVRSMGQTDTQGRYSLRTERQGEGAIVGTHRVIVEDLAINNAPRDADGSVTQLPPVRFSQSYSDPLKSPLQREVAAGEQTIDLDLNGAP